MVTMVFLLLLVDVIGPDTRERNVYLSTAGVIGVEVYSMHDQVKNSRRKYHEKKQLQIV